MGVMITIAEPDLQVLAQQVPSVPNMTLILAVAFGVGVFLVLALLRILFQVSLSLMLVGLYLAVFAIAAFRKLKNQKKEDDRQQCNEYFLGIMGQGLREQAEMSSTNRSRRSPAGPSPGIR